MVPCCWPSCGRRSSPRRRPRQQRPRLISLDFKDADINNILRILAEFSGLNIVTSDDVKGKVTVKLQNVPWQQALDSVVRAAKLAYVQEGNIIRVDKLENLTKEAEAAFKAEQREVEIQQRRKEADLRLAEQERAAALAKQDFEVKRKMLEDQLVPLAEEVFKLKYSPRRDQAGLDAQLPRPTSSRPQEQKGVEEAITGGVKKEEGKPAGMLSARGQLTIDQRTNSVIVRDIARQPRPDQGVHRPDRPRVAVGPHRGPAGGDVADGRAVPRRDLGRRVDPAHRLQLRRSSTCSGAPPGGPVAPAETVGAGSPTTAANFPAPLGCAARRGDAVRPGHRLARFELRARHPDPGAGGATAGRASSPPRAC